MNIIFLTLSRVADIEERSIYTDLMRKFRDEGHNVYVVSPSERRLKLRTKLSEQNGVHILNVRTLNIQKTNVLEKSIGTLLLERQYQRAIRKHLKGYRFDLILYSTPPVTLTHIVRYLKRKNPKAISYLLLKDIFPQNAVDIKMFSEKSVFYRYFRQKEIALYKVSDYIGCMSPRNVAYLKEHNPFYPASRVDVAPNSIELKAHASASMETSAVREKYGLPIERPIFIYGGNLGKPQGIEYLIRCLDVNKHRTDCCFVIVGNGTEYSKLQKWYETNRPACVRLLKGLPKDEYDQLVQACDVGLIFLDHRFTIPNYPSRLLSYLENKMPVICATDVNTDVGSIAEENGYGYWCESVRPEDFTVLVDRMLAEPERIKRMGESGYEYLKKHYLVEHTYRIIMRFCLKKENIYH